LKNKVENKANEKLKEGKSIEEIKKTTFGIATDPDGDRFAIYYTVYNGSKFEAKFLLPDEAGMIVQKIFLENKYNKLNEYLKANHSDKEISNWLKENNYNIVTVRSADTTSQIDKLAKYYEDKMKKLVSGQLKNEINVSVKITDIGFKNLAEAAKLTKKEGIEPLMLLESSGGLVSGLYDKDGLTATLLPLLLLNNASVTVEEELDTIEKDIKNSELLGRDAIVFEDKKELTAEQQKQNFLDVTNNFKDIYKNIPEMKNYDVETISPVTIENGIEIVFKNGNSLIVRASGTEPKIRIYTKVNATIENKSQLKKENDALMNLGRTLVEKSGNGEYKNYISKTQTVDNNKTIINKLTDYSSKTNNAKNRELLNDNTRSNKLIREMSVGKNNKLQLDFSRTELDEETLELCNNLYDNLGISEKLSNIDMDEDVKRLFFAMYVYYHKVKGIDILSVLPYDNNSAYIVKNAEEKLSDYVTVLGQPGTNGQHSFYQLLHQGVVPSFNAFVGFANSTDDIMADSDKRTAHFKLLSNMIAQADAFFIGRNRQETNEIEKDKKLQTHKVFEGNTPSLVMMFENNDEAAKKELANIGSAISEIAKAVETEPVLKIETDKSVKGEYEGFTTSDIFKEIQKEKSASDKETINQKNSKLTFKSNIRTSLVNKYIELFNIKFFKDKDDNEQSVFDKLNAIFNGDKVNATEDRAVLHSALRNVEFVDGKFVAKSAIKVDGKNVMPNVVNTLNKMTDFANRVINGQWKGATGKEIKTVVSIGIGGSDLGPRGVTNILAESKLDNAPEVRYVSNVDPQDLENQLKGLDPETTLFIIESKTFTTDETMTNANAAKKWLLSNSKLNEDSVKNHFVAVSIAKEEVEKFGIDTNNMFEFWDWVGGRFSVWSAIGLPVMLSIGPKNFADFLKGANNTDEALKEVINGSAAKENISVLAAISYIDRINHLGKQEQFINAPFDFFVDFIQQQSMESLGKFVTVDGKTVAYPTGNVIVPAENSKLGGINVAVGETSNNKYSSDDITTYIDMDELSPESLGELFATFEHVVEISAALWEINAFDQWGVQLGKELMPGVLSAIEGEQTEQAKSKLNLSSQKNVEFINNANANETSKTSFIDRIKKTLENMWKNHAFDFGHLAGGEEVANAIKKKNNIIEENIIRDEDQLALKEVQNQLDEVKLQLQVLDRTSKRSKSVPGAGINENKIEEQIQELKQKEDELEAKIEELKNANAQLDLGLFGNMFKNRSTLRAVFAGVAESLILVPVTVVDTIQKILTGNFN
ncbi:hypothetical protein, partial [Candidatus Ruminimicrobium bovinum]|uniref:hypothetical protein n=1 Tax=Candidatus Ruminimicrobium bovinum TaxID=3242779 RepID=UPI0039B8FA66